MRPLSKRCVVLLISGDEESPVIQLPHPYYCGTGARSDRFDSLRGGWTCLMTWYRIFSIKGSDRNHYATAVYKDKSFIVFLSFVHFLRKNVVLKGRHAVSVRLTPSPSLTFKLVFQLRLNLV